MQLHVWSVSEHLDMQIEWKMSFYSLRANNYTMRMHSWLNLTHPVPLPNYVQC